MTSNLVVAGSSPAGGADSSSNGVSQYPRPSFYRKTGTEVAAKLKTARRPLDDSAPVTDSRQTVVSWMTRWRETSLAASDVCESTRVGYQRAARKHLTHSECDTAATTEARLFSPSCADWIAAGVVIRCLHQYKQAARPSQRCAVDGYRRTRRRRWRFPTRIPSSGA